jgi:phenylalanyl-tRNA synthetase alpha chain
MESSKGQLHPISLITDDIIRVFDGLGFEVATGPELEDEWYNFDALNVAKDHPARDMQDTFWIKGGEGKVLRTHVTATTARFLERVSKEGKFPRASISVGKVFRNEATDATHEMQFFQVDGCAIGEDINLGHLKSTLLTLYKGLLGEDTDIQFRPSFFPFTEPSIEVWVKFRNRWLEMMGGGMIHPNVLKNLGIDPEKYQGFAFGGGVDRILMVKHDIPDVRLLYQGDLRINQF